MMGYKKVRRNEPNSSPDSFIFILLFYFFSISASIYSINGNLGSCLFGLVGVHMPFTWDISTYYFALLLLKKGNPWFVLKWYECEAPLKLQTGDCFMPVHTNSQILMAWGWTELIPWITLSLFKYKETKSFLFGIDSRLVVSCMWVIAWTCSTKSKIKHGSQVSC